LWQKPKLLKIEKLKVSISLIPQARLGLDNLYVVEKELGKKKFYGGEHIEKLFNFIHQIILF